MVQRLAVDGVTGIGVITPFRAQADAIESALAAALSVEELEHRFAAHFAGLTPRERQVCARAATGMSIDATALDLGIARTSVLTYRRRAYERLNVNSPVELCALVTH